MDTAQWPQQGIGIVKSSVDNNNNNNQRQSQIQIERSRARPHKEQALNCPRCNSTNTKFCYYNNYSLSQPRYFCKTCRRYWTEGGSLRNVPVGGGSRKNKRSNSSSSNSNSNSNSNLISSTTIPSSEQMNIHVQNQSLGGSMSALELLRSGISARGLEPFVPGGTLFGAGFGFQEMMRPNSNNSDINNNMKIHSFGNMQEEGDGRVLFPFEDLKQNSVSNGANEGQGDPTLFWNGVNGGGSW